MSTCWVNEMFFGTGSGARPRRNLVRPSPLNGSELAALWDLLSGPHRASMEL
jgi:hypothetical protein